MKKLLLIGAALLTFTGFANAAVPAARNMKVVCGDFTLHIVYGERTGNPKIDGAIFRLDVDEKGSSQLTVKWGTNI